MWYICTLVACNFACVSRKKGHRHLLSPLLLLLSPLLLHNALLLLLLLHSTVLLLLSPLLLLLSPLLLLLLSPLLLLNPVLLLRQQYRCSLGIALNPLQTPHPHPLLGIPPDSVTHRKAICAMLL